MDDVLARKCRWLTLAVVLAPTVAWADAALDQYTVAAGHYARGRWQLAVDEFDRFLERHADHERAAQAIFFSGESFIQLGNYAEARRRFETYLERFAEGRYAANRCFALARPDI